MLVRVTNFGGEQPRVNARLLSEIKAQIARNCRLDSGKAVPLRGLSQEYALVGTPPVASIYYLNDTYWLESASDVDYVKGPVKADTTALTLFTGTDQPRVTDTTLADVGSGAYPQDSLYLGLPIPDSSAVTLTPTVASGTITAASTGAVTSATATANFTAISGVKVLVKSTVTIELVSEAKTSGNATVTISRSGQVIAEKVVTMTTRGRTGEPIESGRSVSLEGIDAAPAGAVTYTVSVAYNGLTYTGSPTETFNTVVTHAGIVDVTFSAAHGRVAGNVITIAAVTGMTDINGNWEILSVNGNQVRIGVLTRQTYSSGGTWTEYFDAEDRETRNYLLTYTTLLGGQTMEGPASAATVSATIGIGQTVTLNNLPVAPAGDYSVNKVRIYRTYLNTDGDTEYLYTGEVNIATTTFVDNVLGAALGEVIESTDWIAPPTSMKGIISTNDGVVIGFDKNVLYPSEPYQVHAYPVKYQKQTHHDVVALATIGDGSIAVLTKGEPYLLTGRSPLDFSLNRLELIEPCSSKRGVVDMGTFVIYPSPNGLVAVGSGRVGLMTENIVTKKEWANYYPTSIIAARWDDKYVGFYTDGGSNYGGIIYDPQNPDEFITLNLGAQVTEAWTHPRTGELYVVIAGNIKKFDADAAAPLTMTWKTKRFVLPRQATFSTARVEAVGTLTVKFYMSQNDSAETMTLFHTESVTGSKTFRLPGGYRGNKFEVEVSGTGELLALTLAETMTELRYAA